MNLTNDNGAHSFTEGATFETAENINEFLKEEKTMEAIRLISMTDFVLEIDKEWENPSKPFSENKALMKICNYATFLKQPLKLEMFIPCYYRNGFPIAYTKDTLVNSMELLNEFEEAKERVLFKGFEHYLFRQADHIQHNKSRKCFSFPNYNGVIIEDLISLEVELTENAIKQIGL